MKKCLSIFGPRIDIRTPNRKQVEGNPVFLLSRNLQSREPRDLLGDLLQEIGETDAAEQSYQAAIDSGHDCGHRLRNSTSPAC